MSEADRDYARLRAYIAGGLPDDECRAFEDRLLRDPQLARELDLSLRMRAGLERLKTQRQLDVADSPNVPSWAKRLGAAVAAVACIALLLWVRPVPVPVILAAHPAKTIVAHYSFISMRGSSVPDLDLPPNGLIELRAVPSSRAPGRLYTVTLVARDPNADRALAILTDVALGDDGYVRSYADAQRLRPGTYELRLQSGSGTDAVKDAFSFKLLAEPRPSP